MEIEKLPDASVVPPPTCAPIVPPVMANAATAAAPTGPFTTVPLTVPAVAGFVAPPPPPQAKRKRVEPNRAAAVALRVLVLVFKGCLSGAGNSPGVMTAPGRSSPGD